MMLYVVKIIVSLQMLPACTKDAESVTYEGID